jgi:hypothetical protein
MDENDQTNLFQKLTKEAELEVKETLDRFRTLSAEAATEAARTAIGVAVTEIKRVEQTVLRAFADYTAAASVQLQDATEKLEDAKRRIGAIEAQIAKQEALIRSMSTGLWILVLIALIILVVVSVRGCHAV